jgi:hypothetical protein
MLKFFRSIRQKLVLQENVKKYLLYAVGEILLVVVGILIALQINNWNAERKNLRESEQFISRLLDEVNINLKHLDLEIAVEERQMSASKSILDLFNMDVKDVDPVAFDSLIFIVFSANTLEFNQGTLLEGQNTGKISLIPSDELRLALYNLPTHLEEVRSQEHINSQDVNEYFSVYLYYNYNYRTMDNRHSLLKGQIGESKFKDFNNLSLLNDMVFENMIDNRHYASLFQLNEMLNLKRELLNIQQLIRKELGRD